MRDIRQQGKEVHAGHTLAGQRSPCGIYASRGKKSMRDIRQQGKEVHALKQAVRHEFPCGRVDHAGSAPTRGANMLARLPMWEISPQGNKPTRQKKPHTIRAPAGNCLSIRSTDNRKLNLRKRQNGKPTSAEVQNRVKISKAEIRNPRSYFGQIKRCYFSFFLKNNA